MGQSSEDIEIEPRPERSQVRKIVAMLVIGTATAQAMGVAMRAATQFEANDISRWCTVWSLVEKGTYAIDECPWQANTQDKVKKPDKIAEPKAAAGPVKKLEYAIAPRAWKEGEATERFYSSKPPLLPTMIAGVLYPIRRATGVPLDQERLQQREVRYVQKSDPKDPAKFESVLEKPKDPVHWPVFVYYFKPVTVSLNILPMMIFLILFARLLDRFAPNDWAWMASLFAAAFGTYLLAFDQTLNNHTIAAYSAFFALYAAIKVRDEPDSSGWNYATCGFFGGFTACNELPAALFGVLLFLMVVTKSPRKALLAFLPAAIVPIAAFLVTQYVAMGQFTPVYEEFGTKAYNYEGSMWLTPLEFDYFNKVPESKPVYLLHMLIGHHGVFSLTPIFLFSLLGIVLAFRAARRAWAGSRRSRSS